MSHQTLVRLCIIIMLTISMGERRTSISASASISTSTLTKISTLGGQSKQGASQSNQLTNDGKQYSTPSTQFTSRQVAATTGNMMKFLSSIIPSVVSSVMPLALIFGLGALIVPALGISMLLRESSRRRSYQDPSVAGSIIDFYKQMSKLIENAENKYEQVNKSHQY